MHICVCVFVDVCEGMLATACVQRTTMYRSQFSPSTMQSRRSKSVRQAGQQVPLPTGLSHRPYRFSQQTSGTGLTETEQSQ